MSVRLVDPIPIYFPISLTCITFPHSQVRDEETHFGKGGILPLELADELCVSRLETVLQYIIVCVILVGTKASQAEFKAWCFGTLPSSLPPQRQSVWFSSEHR